MWKGKGSFLPPIKLFHRSSSASHAHGGPETDVASHLKSNSTTSNPDQVPLSQETRNSTTIVEKGWEGFKIALKILEKPAMAFPPLAMAVGGLIAAIDIIERATANREDFSQMAAQIRELSDLLSRCSKESAPGMNLDRIDGLSRAIQAVQVYIQAKVDANPLMRVLDGSNDAQEIVRCLRTITFLVQRFQLDTVLATESKIHEISSQLGKIEESSVLQNLRRVRNASHKSEDEKRCMPGTRVAILAGLLDWATDPDSPPVFWLSGMAGTGKSSITGSAAELLDGVGILGASFFCSRDEAERRDVKRIIPTLAHSLARCQPAYRSELFAMLDKDPDIGHYGLKEQFSKLIVAPLVSCDCNKVIVIDALDECEAPDATRALLAAFIRHKHLPIKILFSSRPEPQMRENLDNPESNRILRLHDVEEDVVMRDIRLYLENRFAELSRRRKLEHWPSSTDLEIVLHLCGAFFIYAFTVLEYISATGDSRRRLANLVASSTQTNRHYSRVDQLYAFIMESAFHGVEADEQAAMRDMLSIIILLRSPLPLEAIATFLGRKVHPEGELMSLHSVINIPSLRERPVSVFHASFADYMTDPSRSLQFYIDPAIGHTFLATKSLQLMNRHLKHTDGPLFQPVDRHIYHSLAYSCVHWAAHLAVGSCTAQIMDLLQVFVNEHFLHWVEALGWIGRLEDALTSLHVASAALQTIPEISTFVAGISVQNLVEDALEFIPYTFEILKSVPSEVYRSALMWLPLSSAIRRLYKATSLSLEIPQVREGLVESWAACDHVLRHPDAVLHAEFSSDDSRIVSATQDGKVRIWNTVVRDTQLLLEGHADRVNWASFSLDGSQIVSASSDGTVRIWDAAVGTLVLVLSGHSHDVSSAAFSADGCRVVSASKDGTVRIWDTTTGNAKHLLKRGSSQIRSAAFSADCSRVVAARSDRVLDIWDATTGLIEQVLVGHSDEVNSGVFSTDGRLVISASDDATVRVWSIQSGKSERVLTHGSRVWSAAISEDGARIVSALSDRTVCVWNIETEELEQVFRGHPNEVNSASFSQDGSRIVSASDDGTVRIWTTQRQGLPLVPDHVYDIAGDTRLSSSHVFRVELMAAIDDDQARSSLWNQQVYFLSDDHSSVLSRLHPEMTAFWIPAQYRDIVGKHLSVEGSTVSFTLVSGRRVVIDMNAPEREGHKPESLAGGFGMGGGLVERSWDEIEYESIADKKVMLYGSYQARR